MFLETERLILRKFQEADFEDFCEYAIDKEMCHMMGRDNITDAASARPTFDWLMCKEKRSYVLVYKKNRKVIGNLTVCTPSSLVLNEKALAGKKGCALSFSISRHYQRRGLMFEAVTGVIDRLLRIEGMDYINCGHFSFNIPSRALQNKLGFTHLLTDRVYVDGTELVVIENILWRNSVQPIGKDCDPNEE